MLNVTLKFTVYCFALLLYSCDGGKTLLTEQEIQHDKDSVSEARIDSAYLEIRTACDTMMVNRVPKMVDSLLKDSVMFQLYTGKADLFTDADKKVEKVIRQLLADCDSSLLKETYRIARLRQELRTKQHKKAKA